MRGATDVQLRVTMDASQARSEAASLHREMNRRFRSATPDDASRVAWERSVGMPVNPVNPNLAYEQVRHSGIWWANQRGIKGLGGPQYRHQFFNEREAKYMGLQFAKAARKELIAGAKQFAVTMGLYALDQGMSTYYAWAKVPGQNNREITRQEATYGGIRSGASTGIGAAAGLIGLAALAGAPFSGGTSLALLGLAGAGGAAIGGASANSQARAQERNEDLQYKLDRDSQIKMRRWSRQLSFSDMAFRRQLEMTPSREDKLRRVRAQISQVYDGRGEMSVHNLLGVYEAMRTGGVYKGRKYKPGSLDTTEGKYVRSMLSQQWSRYDALRMQEEQLKMIPYARPQEAITDSYSRRGLYVGAQVDTLAFNREIIANMKKIVECLEKMRESTPETDMHFHMSGGKRIHVKYK